MQLITYLNFNGTAAEALKFYAEVFQGEIVELLTYGESPMCDQTPPEQRDQVMHAALKIGDAMIFGGDTPLSMFHKPQGFAVAITLEELPRAERIFAALSEGGEVRMPIQETFWAKRFGEVVDRYGTPWILSAGNTMRR